MGRRRITVMLVEDDPADRRLIVDNLNAMQCSFMVEYAGRLQEAMELVLSRAFDIIILDLELPDSRGFATFAQMCEKTREVPIIVIVERDDDDISRKILEAGAQDCLPKSRISANVLTHCIRHSIERQRFFVKQEKERYRDELAFEQEALERLLEPPTTPVTCCLYGGAPLKEAVRDVFDQIVCQYGMALDMALDRRVLKIENSPGAILRRISEQIGSMFAGPRDVLDIHLDALRGRRRGQPPPKVKALTEEGRFLMIELMGCLVSFYRDYYSGCARTVSKGNEPAKGETS